MAFLKSALKSASLLIIAVFLFSGCSHVSYLVQAGLGQFSLYNHERPLQEVIDDPSTSESVRERLKWIPEIKKLVEAELEVKATGNYTTYVDLNRPFVIWSITAAEPYAIKLKQWSFPIVGSFPYLGFFKEDAAKDWMKDHQDQGYDTYIRGVTAYSTLGYLRDPLLSSMLSRHKSDLVNLIFHETTHGQIYLKGQGSFNEQVANFVGDYGERHWLIKTYGAESKEARDWQNERDDRRRFGMLLRAFAEELKQYYSSTETTAIEQRKAGKVERFATFKRRLESEPWKGRGFARAANMIDNNASLLAFLTYEDDQHVFDLLNKKCGGSLKRSLRYLKSFTEDWDKLKSDKPTITPQQTLFERLSGNTFGVVCLDV